MTRQFMNLKVCCVSPCLVRVMVSLLIAAMPAQSELALKLSFLDEPITRPSNRQSTARPADLSVIPYASPLSLRIELINQGADSVELFPSVDPAAGFVTLYLTVGTNPPQRFTTVRWENKDYNIRPRKLGPGEKLVHETFLFGRLNSGGEVEYMFPESGKYQLLAEHGSGTHSNPLRFEVSSPPPEWPQLKEAGIVDLIEGRLRSHDELARKTGDILRILEKNPDQPARLWIERKARNESPR